MAAYREKNKLKILAKEKERYERKSGEIIARMNAYYSRERLAILEKQKLPPALLRRRTNQKNREARKAGQFVESVDHATLWERDAGICGICRRGIVGDFHVDHIRPLSCGGAHSYANTQIAHPSCNLKKHARWS